MAQQMVGQHAGHHRLAHRHRADADAGVVAALGGDFDLVAEAVDGWRGREDRAGRLDGEPRHDRLAGGDAAQDAAGMVGGNATGAVAAMRISSALSSPVSAAAAKPSPISTPLTALMLISAPARSASSLA